MKTKSPVTVEQLAELLALCKAGQVDRGALQGLLDATKKKAPVSHLERLMRRILKQANKLAESVPSSVGHDRLASVARAYALIGDVVVATRMATGMSHHYLSDSIYHAIVQYYAEAGLFDQAHDVLNKIVDTVVQSSALRLIVLEYVRREEIAKARRFTRSGLMVNPYDRSLAWSAIAKVTSQESDSGFVRDLIKDIRNSHERSYAYVALARATDEQCDYDQALWAIRENTSTVSTSKGYAELMEAYVSNGNIFAARGVASSIQDGHGRAVAYCVIAYTTKDEGDIKMAREAVATISSPLVLVSAMCAIGQVTKSDDDFALAIVSAKAGLNSEDRHGAFRIIAEAWAKAGQFESAWDVARNIESSEVRCHTLAVIAIEIAKYLKQVGQKEQVSGS
jgi:tetratricopeptide (TPR) repeat protein